MLEMKWKMDECRWIYMDNRPEDSVAGEVQVLAKLEINILGLPEISRAPHLSSLALAGNQYSRRPTFYVFSIPYYSVKTHRMAFKLVSLN